SASQIPLEIAARYFPEHKPRRSRPHYFPRRYDVRALGPPSRAGSHESARDAPPPALSAAPPLRSPSDLLQNPFPHKPVDTASSRSPLLRLDLESAQLHPARQ